MNELDSKRGMQFCFAKHSIKERLYSLSHSRQRESFRSWNFG